MAKSARRKWLKKKLAKDKKVEASSKPKEKAYPPQPIRVVDPVRYLHREAKKFRWE